MEQGYAHKVVIPWTGQENYWWNDVCADIMEVFGLPGNRYQSSPQPTEMTFYFKSDKDADLCKILISHRL